VESFEIENCMLKSFVERPDRGTK